MPKNATWKTCCHKEPSMPESSLVSIWTGGSMSMSSWLNVYNQHARSLTRAERIVLTSLAMEADVRSCEVRLDADMESRICAFGHIRSHEMRACLKSLTSRQWLEAGEWDGGVGVLIRLRMPQEMSEASP